MLFNAKAILVEEYQWYYLTQSWGNKKFQIYPKDISPKVNVSARQEFELTYYDVTVRSVNHYTSTLYLCIYIYR